MKLIDRQGHEIFVDQTQTRILKKLYMNVMGRCVIKILTLSFVSALSGKYMNSRLSKIHIRPFVTKHRIDMNQYEKTNFTSYNDFFTRKIKSGYRNICEDENAFIAPADSKLTVYKIDQYAHFMIKDTPYTVGELLQNDDLARQFDGGYCCVFRLTVDDYHRYCFIDKGKVLKTVQLPGKFHTVNPIANDVYPIYKQNTRNYSLLMTEHFQEIVYMEVGALLVGKIVNHPIDCFNKGEEKGYFEFGGSTIILLLKKDIVDIDHDILENSLKNYETRVLMGEKIGVKKLML